VHHPGAGHRVDESGLLAACNTPGEKIQTSVKAIDTKSCFCGGKSEPQDLDFFLRALHASLEIVFTLTYIYCILNLMLK
jgi:hypothetical protein